MKLIRRYPAESERIWHLTFSKNGTWLAGCTANGSVLIYSKAKNYEKVQTLTHPGTVRSCAFSEDGSRLYVSCYDRSIYVYAEDEDGYVPFSQLVQAHEKEIKAVSAGKRTFASCGRDRRVCVWRTGPMQEDDYECLSVFQLHGQDVKSVAFAPDFKTLGSCGYDNCVYFYHEQYVEGELEYVPLAGYRSPVASEDAKEVAGQIGGTVWSLAFLDNTQALAADAHGNVTLLKKTDQKLDDELQLIVPTRQARLHNGPCYRVCLFSKSRILTCGADGAMRVSRLGDFEVEYEVFGHNGEINTVDSSGKLIVTGGDDGVVCMWELQE